MVLCRALGRQQRESQGHLPLLLYGGDFYGLKAAGVCVHDCGHIIVSL